MEHTAQPTGFAELGLSAEICRAVQELGYEAPTPIQTKSIPVILAGRDLIGQAETGTGKTAAFALPLLSTLDLSISAPQVLVLTPTRELAIQVAEAFQSYARSWSRLQVLPVYGGQPIGAQLRLLERRPQVVVGTPGRIMDHVRRGSLDLGSIRALVIDEADEMLSMGFLEDMEWIISHAPAEKQTTLFSATMPKAIRHVAQSYLRAPEEVVIRKAAADDVLIEQYFWHVSGLHKLDALTRILEVTDFDAVLVFVRTRNTAIELADRLESRGYAAAPLNGDMTQDARERTVDRLKERRIDILVATDIAARGLHVDRITHVINFDIPFDAETYTHRIGRTGRAGRSGTAILFVSPRERGLLRSIERVTGARLEHFPMPSREEVARQRSERLKERVRTAMVGTDLSDQLRIVAEIAHESGAHESTVAAALCALLEQESSPQRAVSAQPAKGRAVRRTPTPETRSAEGAAPRPRPRTQGTVSRDDGAERPRPVRAKESTRSSERSNGASEGRSERSERGTKPAKRTGPPPKGRWSKDRKAAAKHRRDNPPPARGKRPAGRNRSA